MEYDVSPVAARDYKDWLLSKTRDDDTGKFRDYVRNEQDGLLLGMWFKDWDASFYLPYELTKTVRHVEQDLLPFQDQLMFFGNKFNEESGGSAELYKYCSYMLDNVMLDDDMKIRLSIYLGKQIGNALELGIEKNLEGSVVFVRTRTGNSFVGVVKFHHGEDVTLVNVHEMIGHTGCLTDVIEFGTPRTLFQKTMLYDVCEIRPCTAEMLYNFVQRTGCTTYGVPQPVPEGQKTES